MNTPAKRKSVLDSRDTLASAQAQATSNMQMMKKAGIDKIMQGRSEMIKAGKGYLLPSLKKKVVAPKKKK